MKSVRGKFPFYFIIHTGTEIKSIFIDPFQQKKNIMYNVLTNQQDKETINNEVPWLQGYNM